MSKKDVTQEFDNFKHYEEKVKKMSETELKMYNDFYESVKHHAMGHRTVTLNNLTESKETLDNLKLEASKLKDSVFYHEETVIVDRQDVIGETEGLVHKENRNVLDYEYMQANNRLDSLDYLNKGLMQSKYNFFDVFKDKYTNYVLDYDNLYNYLEERVKDFDSVLTKYQKEILDEFDKLDTKINDMDIQILALINEKNSKLSSVNDFYKDEMNNYLDNNQTFNLEEDTSSEEIQNMLKDKLNQLDSFKEHTHNQSLKIKKILKDQYLELYNKTLAKLLRETGSKLFGNTKFFLNPEESMNKLKSEIIKAEENNLKNLKKLIKYHNNTLNYKQAKLDCEKKANNLTSNFLQNQKNFYLQYQLDTCSLVNRLEAYYEIYLELLKVDPFLAQIVGEQSTKIINDELNYLSVSQVNKEHEVNVDFDIKTANLKQKINELENAMAYKSERLMLNQDIELLETVKDMQTYFTKHQNDSVLLMADFAKERLQLKRLENAINIHIDYLTKESNINRKFQSMMTKILEVNIRNQEDHKITVAGQASKIKLALKEYDILALHYNTMYENEKRFLVMQSNRVNAETKINNEFVLTTFSNQMRFAAEQINLANDEYRLRVESIIKAIDEERTYYRDIVKNRLSGYRDRQKVISNDYQAILYKNSLTLKETGDKKDIRGLNKELVKHKTVHDKQLLEIEKEIENDQIIADAKVRLEALDTHFNEALEDAQSIRDNTVEEMNILYKTAEEKYNTLKPYLEDQVNPLEPTFYNNLDNINKRHQLKIKKAQKDLDENTKELMEDYLDVFFQDNKELDEEIYRTQLRDLEAEKETLREQYVDNIEQNEELYKQELEKLDYDKETVINNIKNSLNTINQKHSKAISQKQTEIDSLEKTYKTQTNQIDLDSKIEVTNLKHEYSQSKNKNEKYYQNLNKSFDSILDSYNDYIKMSKNNKVVKEIIKSTRSKYQKTKEDLVKKLINDSKKDTYLLD